MESLTTYQQTAIQIASSGSKIATAQQLAELRLARNPDGTNRFPRYMQGDIKSRLSWLGDQFFGLAVLLHVSVSHDSVGVDCVALDNEIMENSVMRELTLVEMQEAFRKGINHEYGDYYGLTSVSMLGFLKGFIRCEKKQAASAIVYKRREQEEREKNSLFFRRLYEAKKAGLIDLPDMDKRIDWKKD